MAAMNGDHTPRPKTAAARLRELLANKDKIIVCPGVYDGLTARIAIRQGFDCLYMVRTNHFLLNTSNLSLLSSC